MPYKNFDIQLTDPGTARVIFAPIEATTDACPLHLDVDDFVARYQSLTRRARVEKADFIPFGEELFDALISGPISRLFYRSLGALQNGDTGLRLRLRIESPNLMQLPWELLYSRDDGGFLSTIKDFSITRYLPVPNPVKAQQISLPLRILVVISAPSDLPRLQFEYEQSLLEDALASLKATRGVALFFEQDARREHLLSRLQNESFHVLHFIGHGGWLDDRGVVALLKEDRTADLVDAETFAGILQACPALRLVTLNACETAREENKAGFSGVGSRLIGQGIPAVVAMQDPIIDKAAIAFVRHLYGSLAGGDSIDRALTLTRQQLHLDQTEQPGAFSIPVLYLHALDGELFQVVRSRAKRLVRVSQQMARLNEASAALSEWKSLHDNLQNYGKEVGEFYRIALNPEGRMIIPWAWTSCKGYLEDILIPFAAEQHQFIGRRYQIMEEGPTGEDWVILAVNDTQSLDELVKAGNISRIQDIAADLQALIFRYMTICNQQMNSLLALTDQLYTEAKEILEAVQKEEQGLQETTLDWDTIQGDLLDLEDRSLRISEWQRFHDLFDSLHIRCATIHSTALTETSISPIARSWNELRDTLISNLLDEAKKISRIGKAYVEFPDGSKGGDLLWAIDIKNKSDELTNSIKGSDIIGTREKISVFRKAIENQYSQIDKNILSEMSNIKLRAIALQRTVALQARVSA
jgi:hypothetical protein